MNDKDLDNLIAKVLDDDHWGNAAYARHESAAKARDAIWARMQAIMTKAEDTGWRASDKREYDKLEAVLDKVSEVAKNNFIDRTGVVAPAASTSRYRVGQPLAADQTFAGYAAAMGHREPRAVQEAMENLDRPLSLAKSLKGAFTGDWRDAEPERELMALSGASAGAGGVMIPTILTSRIIDLARARTRVLQAGAQIVPMENRTVDVARWLTDPDLEWRGENDPIAESDPTLDKVTLNAHTLATVTKASRELVEDTDIENQLEAAFASALALKIDLAALYGSGTGDEPTGVKNTSGVTKTALATNGASPTWDALVASVGRLRDANEEPTAQIMADRTLRSLAGLKDTTGQYIGAPSYLDGVTRLATSQVPLNLTTGTNSDTSDVFTADWAQLYLGVRTSLQITVLNERFMPDAGQYGFVAWWRGDIAVARPKAFDVVTGVRA